MDKMQISMKLSPFLVFKVVILLVLLMTFSCKRAEDAWNELRIMNSSSDTLFFSVTKKYISNIPGPEIKLIPGKESIINRTLHVSGLELIVDDWGDERDTIEIYRNDTLMVKWGGPLRNLPKSTHSFYNENSWEITSGGRENKYTIATFTITEDDFKKED